MRSDPGGRKIYDENDNGNRYRNDFKKCDKHISESQYFKSYCRLKIWST